MSVGNSEESSSLACFCGVILCSVLALPPIAFSNCMDLFTVSGSCFALSYLPVLLMLLVLYLSPSFKAPL